MKARKINNKSNIIGSNLRKYRLLRNLSQNELCKKLDLIGVNLYHSDIYQIEYGKRLVKDYEVLAFMLVLNISFEQLFEGTKENFE